MIGSSGEATWTDFVRRNAAWVIALLAVAASISGIRNGFAFDDVHMIVDNERVHTLSNVVRLFGQTYWPPMHGGALYRPLTVLAFVLEWSLGRGSPLPFHAASIVLYALACVCLFRVLRLVVETDVAVLAAALFAVHPVHTEAVANVVGQAELLVAIFLFLALERYIRARQAGALSSRDVVYISAFYLAGLLSKEHAIVLPGLLLTSELMIRHQDETLRIRLKRITPTLLSLIVVAAAFVAVRTLVAGGLRAGGTNELFSGESFGSRALTMLTVVIEWIRLLFWPAQLSADYSFPRTRLATEPTLGMLPGALVIIGCGVLAWRTRRSMPVLTFAALWIVVTMAIPSNLLVTTGFILAERTLFLASAAVVLVVAVGVVHAWRTLDASQVSLRRGIPVAIAALLVCGIVRSAVRNPVWRDNETLFSQTVDDVPFSSRAHWMLAEHLSKTGRAPAAAEEMMIAVVLGRKDDFVLLGFAADLLYSAGMFGRAMPLYRRALALTPQNEQLRTNASLCLMRLGRVGEARSLGLAGMTGTRSSPRLNRIVATADSLISATHQRSLVLAR